MNATNGAAGTVTSTSDGNTTITSNSGTVDVNGDAVTIDSDATDVSITGQDGVKLTATTD